MQTIKLSMKKEKIFISLLGVLKSLFLVWFVLNPAFVAAQDKVKAPASAPSSSPPSVEELLGWHEVLTYEVRYSFFKLGEVKTEVLKDTVAAGQKSWHMQTVITSNIGIPFVGREENHYNSFFVDTGEMPHTLLYWTDDIDDGNYNDTRYIFEHETGIVRAREKEERDTLKLEKPATAGQLILYISRMFAGTHEEFTIPVFLNLEKGYITVRNTTETEEREYDAFESPVSTFYSEGESTIEGPFGFKGYFKAWFLTDKLRVPVEAHVRVWLGHVKIRLIEYKREPRTTP